MKRFAGLVVTGLMALTGCSAQGEIEAPERVAVGSQSEVIASTIIALMATECTDQLSCSNDTGVVESVSFDPPGMVEVLSMPELPASDAYVSFRALRSGFVTVRIEGDFGSEEQEIELVVPQTSRVVGHQRVLLAPGGSTLVASELLDADGAPLAGFMEAIESSDPAISVTYEYGPTITASGPLGDVSLRSALDGAEVMTVRVSEDQSADRLTTSLGQHDLGVDYRSLAIELWQGDFFLPNAEPVLVHVTDLEPEEGVCQLQNEEMMSNEALRVQLWNPGTCRLLLETDSGLSLEVAYELP